jgi:tetratricopeptide (TPR) repeat protein
VSKLTDIRNLVEQRKYAEALAACDDLSLKQPELLFDVLRQKSNIYSRQGNYELAASELSQIIDSGEASIGDFHSAAFWTLYSGQFKQALDWYLIALKMGEDQNETWFRSNELHLIAYIYMEVGEFDKAINNYLDKDDSDDKNSSFLIPIKGFCGVKQLRDEIRRRASGK